jgi:hypothetical protein
VVRKKLALTLVSEKVGDERVYRIVCPDAQQPVKTKSTQAVLGQAPAMQESSAPAYRLHRYCQHSTEPAHI